MNRRHFLSRTSALVTIGGVPGLWRRAAAAADPGPDAKTLVVVELTGGNDGLNTVVPYRDDAYHRERPTLRVAPGKVLKLDDTLGLHPAMTDLHQQWEDGKLRVVMNVGYPKPSRSHFRSREIWQSGDLAPTPTSGWLGRVSEGARDRAPACFVGSGSTPLAVRGREVAPFALRDIEGMKLRPDARLAAFTEHEGGSRPADRVAQAMRAAGRMSDNVAALRPNDRSVEREGLEARLSTVCTLIESGVGSRIYYAALDGFDTHSSQEYAHQDLLRQLSSALARFQSDLEARKLDDRVVLLVYSEFGRRIEENGSKGTDHGAAAPVLLLGSPVAGGLLGEAPDLVNLDEGEVRFSLDFRDLYAGVLVDWLGVDSASVIGRGKDERVTLFRT